MSAMHFGLLNMSRAVGAGIDSSSTMTTQSAQSSFGHGNARVGQHSSYGHGLINIDSVNERESRYRIHHEHQGTTGQQEPQQHEQLSKEDSLTLSVDDDTSSMNVSASEVKLKELLREKFKTNSFLTCPCNSLQSGLVMLLMKTQSWKLRKFMIC